MNNSTEAVRAILVGGASHSGKTTLAQSLSSALGWSHCSTDKLARHPGRPWRNSGKEVPEHVADHYSNLSIHELLSDVLDHYKRNVMPQVEALLSNVASDPAIKGLVIEGSALWPEYIAELDFNKQNAIWLTASDTRFRMRILQESGYRQATRDRKNLIEKFLERTLIYNTEMISAVKRLGFRCLDVESAFSKEALVDECLKLLNT